MKNILILILLFAVGAGIFGMISKYANPSQKNIQPTSSTTSESTSNIILGIGQKEKIGDITITLNKVTQDSRCPTGVQCIWAGAVTTNITLIDATHTVTKDLSSNEAPYTFGKNIISIISVSPAPINKNKILESDYKITFNIIPKPQVAPTSNGNNGYLSGRVTISPVCPVERIPPDPQCAPKGYSLSINVVENNFLKQINSDANGYFDLNLPAGTYNLKPISVNVYPRCMETDNIIVKVNSSTTAQISCDSGIR